MKERPILFNAAMVQAILAGRKTQTRRLAKGITFNEKTGFCCNGWAHGIGANDKETMSHILSSKYGPRLAIGDRLWVRETFRPWHEIDTYCGCYDICTCPSKPATPACYLADGHSIEEEEREEYGIKWKPSIHMPRSVCRIILEITNVRVERLQDISEADAQAEGFELPPPLEGYSHSYKFKARHNFRFQWDQIYKNWSENPWVWVIEFKVLTTNGTVPEVAV